MPKSIDVAMDDRRDGVEEGERGFAGERTDRVGKVLRRERPGGDNDVIPVCRRHEDFLAADFDQRLAFQRRGDGGGKTVAVDGQRAAGGELVRIGRAHDQRAEVAHLGVQQADGAPLRIVGAEGIGANKLGELPGLVGGGRAGRPHFVQHDRYAAACDLPGGFGTGEASAHHMNGCDTMRHDVKLGAHGPVGNAWRRLLTRPKYPGSRSGWRVCASSAIGRINLNEPPSAL